MAGETSEHFRDGELACKCCGVNGMQRDFLKRLELLRNAYRAPMVLTSAYRCPKHNAEVSKTGLTGPHTTGRAVDVLCSGADAMRLFRLALEFGFTGFGVHQKGPAEGRYLHLDDILGAPAIPRPRLWSY